MHVNFFLCELSRPFSRLVRCLVLSVVSSVSSFVVISNHLQSSVSLCYSSGPLSLCHLLLIGPQSAPQISPQSAPNQPPINWPQSAPSSLHPASSRAPSSQPPASSWPHQSAPSQQLAPNNRPQQSAPTSWPPHAGWLLGPRDYQSTTIPDYDDIGRRATPTWEGGHVHHGKEGSSDHSTHSWHLQESPQAVTLCRQSPPAECSHV